MRLPDLSPSIQLLLIGLLVVASAALLVRAMMFIRCEKVGVRPTYPKTWSAPQCRALERFRLLVGLGLIPLWGSFLLIAHWPFEFWDVIFIIWLLLISNAWLVRLLDSRNWEKFGAISRSFWITITFLVVWWGVVFTATGWMFAPSIIINHINLIGPHWHAELRWRPVQIRYLIGKAAYGNWRSDAPGIRRGIHQGADLPAPYGSSSMANSASVVGKSADARLNVPLGSRVTLLARFDSTQAHSS